MTLHRRLSLLVAALAWLAQVGSARADVDFKFSGMISSDIRYRMSSEEIPPPPPIMPTAPAAGTTAPAAAPTTNVPYPSQQRLLRYGISRNETAIRPQITFKVDDRIKAAADIEFVWYGYSDANDIDALTLHERIDPYRLEAHALYLDIYKILPKVDLRIGRQVVHWGSADKFNPTNNINSLDLSDPLLFGRALGNNMVRLDWNPTSDVIVTGVWVPVFRPAQLPRTAPLAVTQPERPAPVQDDSMRTILGMQAAQFPPTAVNVYTVQPEPSLANSQFGARLSGRVLGQDMAVSFYQGRFGIPVPAWVSQHAGGAVDVGLVWPKQRVIGFDVAGSIERLKGIGYWVEGAVTFPEEVPYNLNTDLFGAPVDIKWVKDPKNANAFVQQFGGAGGQSAIVVPSTPFLKLTAGLDYSWNKYLYSNFQYVHGFIDEWGAGKAVFLRPGGKAGDPARVESRLGDYLVVGTDLKVFNEVVLLRFFGAFKVPSIGDTEPRFTAVLFPQIAWTVWTGAELSLSAFVFLGDSSTKFGDPAAGATELVAKAKYSW